MTRHSANHIPARLAVAALCLGLAIGASAATPAASSGQLLQQVPSPPRAPHRAAPSVTILKPTAPTSKGGPAFLIRHVTVDGATLVSQADIRRIVAVAEGKRLDLAQLQGLARRITALYAHDGYPYTQAYIPAQTVRDGILHIGVLEARYDSVELRNKSRIRDSVIEAALARLQPGKPVAQASLDRALLLASDLPSTTVKGVLRPGRTTGASQLLVYVAPGPMGNTSVGVDDYGNSATGRERIGATGSLYNPLRLGDILSASALTAGRGMSYESLAYAVPLHGPATTLQAGISHLDYRIVNGSEGSLGAHGTAGIGDLALQRTLVRSMNLNVRATLSYDVIRLRDEIDVSSIHTDRHTEDWHASLDADVRDSRGVTHLGFVVTSGRVIFDNSAALVVDESSARTRGGFSKYTLTASRVQKLTDRNSLYVAVQYQGADKNLDVSEQLFVGGPASVRAYDNGLASGSQGHSETIELRRDLFATSRDRWQASVFLDHAQIQLQARRYSAGTNIADFSGAGVGLNWVHSGGWSLVSALATPFGAMPNDIPGRGSVRFWARVQKVF